MKSDSYIFPRLRYAELHGEAVEFTSFFKPGTYGLWSDAVEACKQAGIYQYGRDADDIEIR